jgi:hypothetical protein
MLWLAQVNTNRSKEASWGVDSIYALDHSIDDTMIQGACAHTFVAHTEGRGRLSGRGKPSSIIGTE